MKLTGVLVLAVACIVAVTAAPPPEKLDEVVQALKDVRQRLEEEMETLDELVAEAEGEAPAEVPEQEERGMQEQEHQRGWGGSFTCGGSSGRQQWTDQDYAHLGKITGFKIWHERIACYIEGVQFRYGHTWAPQHNGRFKPEVEVDFASDEHITGVAMDKRNEWGTEVVCKITFHTNKRVYGPYCGYRCDNNRCGSTDWGNFGYVSGRHGSTLDSLSFHEWYD